MGLLLDMKIIYLTSYDIIEINVKKKNKHKYSSIQITCKNHFNPLSPFELYLQHSPLKSYAFAFKEIQKCNIFLFYFRKRVCPEDCNNQI